jgi:hypothetical protein
MISVNGPWPAKEVNVSFPVVPLHIVLPVSDPWDLAFTVTARILGPLVPQSFFAATDMSPLTEPGVTVIELVAEVPVHPPGRVHIYEVAPVIAATL